ncbi:hypothetical protein ACM41_14835 [Bradyrhizobium sp. CCBAU 21362]|uniref:hypothetical protein n=1 Tax=Bradyrhizobium sp. CCBAU 21362 TaxID=1325082 RepID=UPI003FA4C4A5|nr:hypothetical protein [Bradyrhizobium sp. CCBAU 21362]
MLLRVATQLSGGDFGDVAEAIDQVVKDKLTRPMLSLRMFMDSLELRPAFWTAVCVSLCAYPLQSGRLGERDARTVFANGVDGQALKLRLCHSPEDVFKIAIEPGAGRFIIIVRCHNSHTDLVRGAPPPTIIPLIPSRGLENRA